MTRAYRKQGGQRLPASALVYGRRKTRRRERCGYVESSGYRCRSRCEPGRQFCWLHGQARA